MGDQSDTGYCPQCQRELDGLTVGGKGFCEEHGWVFANWSAPDQEDENDDED